MKAYMAVAGNVSEADALKEARVWCGLDGQDYAAKVTCDAPYAWDEDGSLTQSWGIADALPETDLNIINALKQVEDLGTSARTSPGRKKVSFLFGAELVKLQDNTTGKHNEYPNAIYFQGHSYLDIIYGKNIYYKGQRGSRI